MRVTVWFLSALLLGGCGWHLRGVMPLPSDYRVLYLQSQASNNITRQLKLQLEFNDVVLTEKAEDAQATLTIKPLELDRRVLSRASSGQVAEFELNARLYAILKRNDRNSEVPIEVRGRRHTTNDVNNVLGSASIEQQQLNDLEKDLVNKLLLRLQRLDYDAESIEFEQQ